MRNRISIQHGHTTPITHAWLLFAGAFIAIVFAGRPCSAADAVSFVRDVQPILERRCVACHGAEKQKGGLRLDTREFAEQGGASGRSLLAGEIKTNELILRVTSDELGYRMPLEGMPLADNEIAILKQWVAAGADWPKTEPVATPDAKTSGPHDPWWFWYTDRAETMTKRFGYTLYLLLALLIASLVARRLSKTALPSWVTAWTSPWGLSLLVLAILLGGMVCYAVNLHRELSSAERAIGSLQGKPAASLSDNATLQSPTAYTPRRPNNSLTPTYFRGNDERNPALFNGGFYRTATFHLALCNQERQVLAVGDAVGQGPLLLRVEIERPPNTTDRLYTPAIMKNVVLSPVVPTRRVSGLADLVRPLEVESEGLRWAAYFPVQVSLQNAESEPTRISGIFYFCRGDVNDDVLNGEAHYQVEYDLTVEQGKLTESSNLSMGSLLRWGTLQVTEPGKIQEMEWFDNRDIPVITGANSTDPKLLGIEEHLEPE